MLLSSPEKLLLLFFLPVKLLAIELIEVAMRDELLFGLGLHYLFRKRLVHFSHIVYFLSFAPLLFHFPLPFHLSH